MIAFAKYSNQLALDGVKDQFLPSVLYECLTHEKTEMVNLYLNIHRAITNASSGGGSICTTIDIWNVKMIISYYNGGAHNRTGLGLDPLIQSGYISSVEAMLRSLFDRGVNKLLLRKYLTGRILNDTVISMENLQPLRKDIFCAYLEYYDIPRQLDEGMLRYEVLFFKSKKADCFLFFRHLSFHSLPLILLQYPSVSPYTLVEISSIYNDN